LLVLLVIFPYTSRNSKCFNSGQTKASLTVYKLDINNPATDGQLLGNNWTGWIYPFDMLFQSIGDFSAFIFATAKLLLQRPRNYNKSKRKHK
jgi:hypothetical protein